MSKPNQKPRSRDKSVRRAPSDRDSASAVVASGLPPAAASDAPRTAPTGPEYTGTRAPVEKQGTDSAGTHDPTRNLRLEWIEAGSLTDNPANWRRHPAEQVSALRDLLEDPEVGWAGACLFNERTGRLIDGHARKGVVDPSTPIPVLVGSWSEDAEAKILATLDPVAALAAGDRSAYEALIDHVQTDSLDVRDLLDRTLAGIGRDDGADDADDDAAAGPEMPEMELRPFEHYDYVLVLATNSLDWEALCEALSLERVNSSPIPGKRKIGLCRAIHAGRLLTLLGRQRAVDPAQSVTHPLARTDVPTAPAGPSTRANSTSTASTSRPANPAKITSPSTSPSPKPLVATASEGVSVMPRRPTNPTPGGV